MTPSNPFDFSDFGPAGQSGPAPGPGGGGPSPSGPAGGFDPWAGQPARNPAAPTQTGDAFGAAGAGTVGPGFAADAFGSTGAMSGPALRTAGPPLIWVAAALALALGGAAVALIGVLTGGMIGTALTGWLLAGPAAIGALAVYNRVDTRRRTASIYSAPAWTARLYWVVLAACLVGIALSAWQIASWAGRI